MLHQYLLTSTDLATRGYSHCTFTSRPLLHSCSGSPNQSFPPVCTISSSLPQHTSALHTISHVRAKRCTGCPSSVCHTPTLVSFSCHCADTHRRFETGEFSDLTICTTRTQYKVHRADVYGVCSLLEAKMWPHTTRNTFIIPMDDTIVNNVLHFCYGLEPPLLVNMGTGQAEVREAVRLLKEAEKVTMATNHSLLTMTDITVVGASWPARYGREANTG